MMAAQRSAVTRLPRRDPGGAGVTIPIRTGVIRFSESYDEPRPPETAMRLLLLPAAIDLSPCGPVGAHYHMLLPERVSVKSGDAVIVTYQYGHPFEHELSDAEPPAEVSLVGPDGKSVAVTDAVQPVELTAGERKVRGFQITVRPPTRGDHTLVVAYPA